MSTEVIELRQRDGQTPDDQMPADFQVQLQKPVLVNDGDAVSVKAAFLDTEAAGEEKIVITDDLTLHFQCGYYYVLSRDDQMDIGNGGADGYADRAGGATSYVDGKTYVLMKESAATGNYLQGLQLHNTGDDYVEPDSGGTWTAWWVELLVTFQYYNMSGDLVSTTVDLNDLEWTSTDGITFNTDDDVRQIVYDKTKNVPGTNPGIPVKITQIQTGQYAPGYGFPNNQKANYWSGGNATYTFQDGSSNHYKFDLNYQGDVLNPPTAATGKVATFTQDSELLNLPITLPKGNYAPLDLTTVINRQLQRDNPPAGQLLDSQFLLKYDPATAPFTSTMWIAEDRSAAFETKNPLDAGMNGGMLIGATNMVLDYDTDRKRFFWSYLHSPYLGAPQQAVATEAVGFVPKQDMAAGSGDAVLIRRNSGIFFTQLSAKRTSDGVGVGFWDSMLGFDLSTLLAPDAVMGAQMINALAIPDLHMPASIPVNECTTAGYAGLDILANRTDQAGWWHMPTLAGGPPTFYFSSSNGITEEIFAGKGVVSAVDSFGYYLLDIQAKYGQEFVGANQQFRSIRGIVSRFYENDAFTAASEADGIPYIHKGEPLLLDAFRVRILQDDKELAPNLGNRNCVFLQVQRPE